MAAQGEGGAGGAGAGQKERGATEGEGALCARSKPAMLRAERSMKAMASRVKKPHLGKRPMKFYITCHVRTRRARARARACARSSALSPALAGAPRAQDMFLDLRRPHGDVVIIWRRGRKVVTVSACARPSWPAWRTLRRASARARARAPFRALGSLLGRMFPAAAVETSPAARRGPRAQSKPVKVDEVLDPVDGTLTVTASFPAQDLALLCTIFLGGPPRRAAAAARLATRRRGGGLSRGGGCLLYNLTLPTKRIV